MTLASDYIKSLKTGSEWEMTEQGLLLMRAALSAHRPRSIVEYGSGTTTLVAGLYCSDFDSTVATYEHAQRFHHATLARLSDIGIPANVVDFRVGPLRNGTTYDSFNDARIDMIVLDGPPAYKTTRLSQAMNAVTRLNSGGIMLVDDFERDEIVSAYLLNELTLLSITTDGRRQTALLKRSGNRTSIADRRKAPPNGSVIQTMRGASTVHVDGDISMSVWPSTLILENANIGTVHFGLNPRPKPLRQIGKLPAFECDPIASQLYVSREGATGHAFVVDLWR